MATSIIAQKSEPNVNVLTVFCLLEYRRNGALFTKTSTPVCERLIAL